MSKHEEPQYRRDKVMKNTNNINKIRVFSACTAGALAGVLGLTGMPGFLLFLVLSIITTIYLHVVVMGTSKTSTYLMPEQGLYSIGSIFSAIVTYIVVWTVSYDVVHVF